MGESFVAVEGGIDEANFPCAQGAEALDPLHDLFRGQGAQTLIFFVREFLIPMYRSADTGKLLATEEVEDSPGTKAAVEHDPAARIAVHGVRFMLSAATAGHVIECHPDLIRVQSKLIDHADAIRSPPNLASGTPRPTIDSRP